MNSKQVTTSVALFCTLGQQEAVPVAWYERAIELFHEFRLSPILFTAGGGRVEVDDCCLLEDGDRTIYRWGAPEPIVARRAELIEDLRRGEIDTLDLDAPRADGRCRSDWHLNISLSSFDGEFFLGVDEELVFDVIALLRLACKIAKGLVEVRYGFGYKMPLVDEPAAYSMGGKRFTLADFQDSLKRRQEGTLQSPTADELWEREPTNNRRHLTGYFRRAFPTNVLSEAHVQAADLQSSPIGRLSRLNESLWLWELTESEIPAAEARLRDKKRLVAQLAAT
jgi:hypothetical protein